MNKKVTLDFLANELNISKTTVSKAVNNCPGIKSETKSLVLNAAKHYGYSFMKPAQKVAVVLPSVPDYFWGKALKYIDAYNKEMKIDCKYYIYNNLSDGETVAQYIDSVIDEKASVLIIAAPDFPETRKQLEKISGKMLVILLEEFLEIKNAFYVGQDSFTESFKLCERYLTANQNAKSFSIIKSTGFENENIRIEGFTKCLKEHNISYSFIESDPSFKAQAAFIAGRLSEAKALPDCVFCPSGNTENTCLAIKKLKAFKKIDCIGFDINPKKAEFISEFIVMQNIKKLSKTATELAKDFLDKSKFPQNKYNYI